jgi:hypothetical protein
MIMICSDGLKQNKYTEEIITGYATLDDLFASGSY